MSAGSSAAYRRDFIALGAKPAAGATSTHAATPAAKRLRSIMGRRGWKSVPDAHVHGC
jgi:hypothetical protein